MHFYNYNPLKQKCQAVHTKAITFLTADNSSCTFSYFTDITKPPMADNYILPQEAFLLLSVFDGTVQIRVLQKYF